VGPLNFLKVPNTDTSLVWEKKKEKSGPGWIAEKYKKIKIKSKTFSKLFS
jgi:hypothetical protein